MKILDFPSPPIGKNPLMWEKARYALQDTAPLLARADATRPTAWIAAIMKSRGMEPPENDVEMVRAMLTDEVLGLALNQVVLSSVLSTFREVRNTARPLYQVVNLPDFKSHTAAMAEIGGRLEALPPGGTAAELDFTLAGEPVKLARFAAATVLDEQSIVDASSIGVLTETLAEAGRAAGRLIPDMVFSALLANDQLGRDSTALFAAGRGNLSTDALANTSLRTAYAAVAGMTRTDARGAPCHLGLVPKFLLTNPTLAHVARELVRTGLVDTDDGLEVICESRIGAAGLVDPRDGTPRTGSATCWGLFASRPLFLLAALDGNVEPQTRQKTLQQGQWGVSVDVRLDVGLCVAEPLAGYWSTGTG